MVMSFIISALAIAAALGVQYLLSNRSNVYLGAIIPILFLAIMTWRYFDGKLSSFTSYILITIIVLISLIEQWVRGRRAFKKNQEKELDRMRTRDM
ncbi:hypothetical protein [Exiguobacterium sp. s191]|uniref:hypothetical protein n=1 Tax=Exiguobacterium sp. s191 TaxID=2751196 RepID=UPI001BE88570|nr:hypothetical protein [Exiguobacterium sp. s191]